MGAGVWGMEGGGGGGVGGLRECGNRVPAGQQEGRRLVPIRFQKGAINMLSGGGGGCKEEGGVGRAEVQKFARRIMPLNIVAMPFGCQ